MADPLELTSEEEGDGPDAGEVPPKRDLDDLWGHFDRMSASYTTLQHDFERVNSGLKKFNRGFDEIKGIIKFNHDELTDRITKSEEENRALRTELTRMRSKLNSLEKFRAQTADRHKFHDREQRSYNVIIRGIPEEDRHERVHDTIAEMIDTATPRFTYLDTDGALRMGQSRARPSRAPARDPERGGPGGGASHSPDPHWREGRDARHAPFPRPIKLRCTTKQQKSELFRQVSLIKENPKFVNVSLSNDLDDDELMVFREVQVLHNAARGLPGVNSRMRGAAIEIDGEIYRRNQFHNLPHGLNLVEASTIITDEGALFQGHCSPLSNFFPCDIRDEKDKSIKYSSSEQMIVRTRALEAGERGLAEEAMNEHNPYKLKRISARIPLTPGWKKDHKQEVKKCVRAKLNQHPQIKEAIVKCPTTKFYEGTLDPTYGAGIRLSQADLLQRPHFKLSKRFKNEMGEIYTELQQEFPE